jgi:phage tail-like protein
MPDRSATSLGGDPPTSNRFLLEVDGVQIGIFTEVSGLTVSVQVEEYAEGGQNGFAHQLPGRMTWPHLVFKRGLTDSDALFQWMGKTAGDGFAGNGNKLTRATGAITVIDTEGNRLRAWNVQGIMPVRWTGPELSVQSTAPMAEELEVAHHGFTSKTTA